VAVVGDVLRLAVVGAEGDPRRAVLASERDQRLQVARSRRFPDQQPEARPQSLAPLLGRRRLVIRHDPGGCVRVQLVTANARRVTVDVTGEGELRELGRRARDDA